MLDRYLLRYFLAVIDEGNFSKAAAACNVTQPTLSIGIAKLETQLGKPVFRRSNRRVELTEAGVKLAAHARRIESAFREAERTVTATPDRSTLRLGLLASLAPTWVDAILSALAASYATDRLEVVVGRERDLAERLRRGRIDAALTLVSSDATDALVTEGFALAVPATHRLARRDRVDATEAADEAMIVRRHCERLADISRHFTARGIRPFFAARASDDDQALRYVRCGLGVTVAPESFGTAGVAMVPLADLAITRTIGLVHADHAGSATAGLTGTIRTTLDPAARL